VAVVFSIMVIQVVGLEINFLRQVAIAAWVHMIVREESSRYGGKLIRSVRFNKVGTDVFSFVHGTRFIL
jgi:hypothetical protein